MNHIKKRTRIKRVKSSLIGKRLFTNYGGIAYYRILKVYEWKEYCKHALTPSPINSHWFKHDMAKIKTESGVVMKIPFCELKLNSVFADTGEKVC